jgi:DnaJ-class molecular chaperone
VRNHYVTLGIMQDATPREVVYAYRHLARKLHPDLHPDDPEAAERFRDVHEAYEVLSDPRPGSCTTRS